MSIVDSAAAERDAVMVPPVGSSLRWAEGRDVVADETDVPSPPAVTAAAAEAPPVRRRFGRRRANAPGGRQHSHRVLVTPEEEARLARLAAAGRVTVPRLLVEAALAGSGESATVRRDAIAELFAVHRLLAAVSNNVNQIARHANASGELSADAAAALAAVRRVAGRIDGVMDRLSRP